jgi:hypothetical protein
MFYANVIGTQVTQITGIFADYLLFFCEKQSKSALSAFPKKLPKHKVDTCDGQWTKNHEQRFKETINVITTIRSITQA